MAHTIRFILPDITLNQTTYFSGYVICADNLNTIYITNFVEEPNLASFGKESDRICGVYKPNSTKLPRLQNFFVLEKKRGSLRIKQLFINNKEDTNTDNVIIMMYDYDTIKNSETISPTSDYFSKLQNLIQQIVPNEQREPDFSKPNWLASSMFGRHLFNYACLIHWIINTVTKNRRISLKSGNLILAILIDIIIGYFILHFLMTQDKKEITVSLMGILEKFVNFLYSLLKWLMGAPAGLKLNNAFNKMLGKYFSYHIQLWWLFLDVSGEKMDVIIHFYQYIGYLGFTFQAALISDLMCIATFHSYCIYVYAARLFNIQVSGLIALLRLFVGRKYNPLRGGIDSCEYTNQELFVGTVAFAILLLLLPTTVMYYTVFTLFRLMSIMVQYILVKVIYFVHTLPLYVVLLWFIQSPKVAGKVLIEVISNEEKSPLILRVKLLSNSLTDLINNYKPSVEVPNQIELTKVISNILVGKQII